MRHGALLARRLAGAVEQELDEAAAHLAARRGRVARLRLRLAVDLRRVDLRRGSLRGTVELIGGGGRRDEHGDGGERDGMAEHRRTLELIVAIGAGIHHVGRLQIAVHDAHAVGVRERRERLHAQLGRSLRRERAHALDHVLERLAAHELHDHQPLAFVLEELVDGGDARDGSAARR